MPPRASALGALRRMGASPLLLQPRAGVASKLRMLRTSHTELLAEMVCQRLVRHFQVSFNVFFSLGNITQYSVILMLLLNDYSFIVFTEMVLLFRSIV